MKHVLFLHGFAGSPAMWDPVVQGLANGDVLLSRPLLPGHGLAPRGMHGDFEAAVDGLLAEHDREPLLVVGYSLGGRLALGMGARRPTLSLLLIGAHVGIGDDGERAARRRWEAEQAAILRERGVEAFIDAWEAMPIFASQSSAQRAAQRAMRTAHTASGLAWAMESLGLGRMPDHRSTAAGRWRWLTGARDVKFTELTAGLGASHRIVADAGHNVVLEAPAVVVEEVAAWLGKSTSPQTPARR